jgi:diguanylate cyclase (GGDEF)-like protein/PAS domain S-box-containing protein
MRQDRPGRGRERRREDVERAARLRLLVEQMPVVLWSTDADLRITSFMGAWGSSPPLEPDRIPGASLAEFLGVDDPKAPPIAAHQRALTGGSATYEAVWQARTFHVRVEPLRDASGTITGVVGAALDITERKRSEEELRKLSLAVEQSPASVLITDREGNIEYVNPKFTRLTGYSRDEVRGVNPSILKSGDLSPDAYRELLNTITSGTEWRGELHTRKKSGEFFWEAASISPIKNGQGKVTHFISVTEDITERKGAEEALKESEERYRILFQRSVAGVFRSTLEGQLLDCNDAFLGIFGWDSREELLSQHAPGLLSDPEERSDLLARLRKEGSVQNRELALRRKDGQPIWVLENVSLVPGRPGEPELLVGTVLDITDRKRAQEAMVHQAFHDELTGLPNRRLFEDRLSLAIGYANRSQKGLAVLYLDLDQFKQVNDALGHGVGDWLLKAFTERLEARIRQGDTIARMGGDEFAILLPIVEGAENAAALAKDLLHSFEKPMLALGHELFVTASIGIALFPIDGTDGETLLKNADNAMYRAKALGRNTIQLCTPELNRQAMERLALERDLRHAHARGEFDVHYQPFYATTSERIVGVEALLRWQRAGHGFVPPEEFVPVAEETRLIFQIGEWVLQTACRVVRAWKDMGFPELRAAVNVSRRQFHEPGLAETVARALEKTRLEPGSLDVEISESTAMYDPDRTLEVLESLRKLGIGLAMDDFGRGPSSLRYLSRLPIHRLKIGRSFITGMTEQREIAVIVDTVIAMAHSLGLKVIAEGVESDAQFSFLKDRGCDEVQGYWLTQPLPAAAVERMLKTSN